MSENRMEEESNQDQDSLSGSQPINEYLFIEREESSSASNDDSDDDSVPSSDQECFRPPTPIEEIEKEEKEKIEQAAQREPQKVEFTGQSKTQSTENQPQRKKAPQPSTCCILI